MDRSKDTGPFWISLLASALPLDTGRGVRDGYVVTADLPTPLHPLLVALRYPAYVLLG
jgi:hypothetical protein